MNKNTIYELMIFVTLKLAKGLLKNKVPNLFLCIKIKLVRAKFFFFIDMVKIHSKKYSSNSSL